ncbi:unnamed protein product, partial [Durusdinium trenchii]
AGEPGYVLCQSPPPLMPSSFLTGDRERRLDKAATLDRGCWGEAFRFLERAAERIIWKGLLFDKDVQAEEPILVDPGASYEACPAALLMALLSCGARAAAAQRVQLLERWHDAYAAWNSLPWTKSLAWHNLQDPLVRLGLYAVVSQSKVITACLLRPEDLCSKVISTASDALDRAAGMSLSVAYDRYSNLPGYGDLAHSMHVMSNYPHLLDSAASCVGARLLAHLFTARRLLDLQPNWAERHLQSAQELTRLLLQNDSQHPSYGGAVNVLGHGLEVHQHWMKQTAERAGPVAPSLTGVLERIFALIGITNGYYVEVGTQSAEQCNTRYLRVRYGFHGLLVDDNFQNPHVNQTRRFVTPANVVEIFEEYDVPKNFDLLSLDTDGFEWLLWMKLQEARFLPRLVILEYGESLPFMEDLLVRYSTLPIHRLCLSQLQQFPRVSGSSIYSLLRLGLAWGYHLIHVVACGTSDLIFVRQDVLEAQNLTFPAQDDPEGLCALAAYQCEAECTTQWPKAKPEEDVFTTAEAALTGDLYLNDGWSMERLMEALC